MHTILSSKIVLEASFLSHIKTAKLQLHSASLIGDYAHVIYGPDVRGSDMNDLMDIKDNVSCMCAGLDNQKPSLNSHASKDLLTEYLYNKKNYESWRKEPTPYSCTLFDVESQSIFLFGDTVGSVPLWYSLSSKDKTFMITSDLIGAQRNGYKYVLTPLGPGQTVALNISTFELIMFSHWQTERLVGSKGRLFLSFSLSLTHTLTHTHTHTLTLSFSLSLSHFFSLSHTRIGS
jgi:hypothetical protein